MTYNDDDDDEDQKKRFHYVHAIKKWKHKEIWTTFLQVGTLS